MSAAQQPQFIISAAAAMLAMHPRTLRNYEKAGLVTPHRKGKWRYYSLADLAWIRCLAAMIHEKGITINAIGKLLRYAPCWEIADCPAEQRYSCQCARDHRATETTREAGRSQGGQHPQAPAFRPTAF